MAITASSRIDYMVSKRYHALQREGKCVMIMWTQEKVEQANIIFRERPDLKGMTRRVRFFIPGVSSQILIFADNHAEAQFKQCWDAMDRARRQIRQMRPGL